MGSLHKRRSPSLLLISATVCASPAQKLAVAAWHGRHVSACECVDAPPAAPCFIRQHDIRTLDYAVGLEGSWPLKNGFAGVQIGTGCGCEAESSGDRSLEHDFLVGASTTVGGLAWLIPARRSDMRHWILHAVILHRTQYSSIRAGVHLRPEAWAVHRKAHANTQAGKPATVLAGPGIAKDTAHSLPDPLKGPIHARLWSCWLRPAHRKPDFEFPGPAEAEMTLLTSRCGQAFPRRCRSLPWPRTTTRPHCRGARRRMIGRGPALPRSFRSSSVPTEPLETQNTSDGGLSYCPPCSLCLVCLPPASSAHSTAARMMARGPPPYHTIAALAAEAGHDRTNMDIQMVRLRIG